MTAKKRFPWKIGTTSFILPATIEENVVFLARLVDDVQLLFFETPSASVPANDYNAAVLQQIAAQWGVGFTVHLPVDIRPGSSDRRKRVGAVDVIVWLLEELAPLAPRCYDLHLPLEDDIGRDEWLDNIDAFLYQLARRIGQLRTLVAIENIDYPFGWIRSLVTGHGFSLCLDVGHALLFADNLSTMLADLSGVHHVHYHGVREGRDHQALHAGQQALTE
ncbi:MAG: cobamide remodeling phosphodiesterase CbiR, partial [Thermodesulfobacteriota bacterium]